jgi:hypothetical protein
MTYYLVMDAWNATVARFSDEADAKKCARACGGHVIYIKPRPQWKV